MTLKSEKTYREPPLWKKKEFKSSVLKIVDSSSSLPANSICSDAADIYPRRKDTKPVTEFKSARDICISILRRERLLGTESELSQKSSPNDNERSLLFECVGCRSMEDPLKMLICDRCEGAFHLSCCKPHARNIPQEKWYCQVCSKKEPKKQREKLGPKHELPNPKQKPHQGLTIQAVLLDTEPYEIDMRIGPNFQADVPEWSGPIPGNEYEFVEPSELGPETAMISSLPQFKKSSVDNWIQCREALETGVICGKWRRAPLSAVQTSDWDCSCAFVWDPIHSDCAVRQELDTDEVLKQLKQLKIINKNKNQLGDKKKKRKR